jgi:hypothetical protein
VGRWPDRPIKICRQGDCYQYSRSQDFTSNGIPCCIVGRWGAGLWTYTSNGRMGLLGVMRPTLAFLSSRTSLSRLLTIVLFRTFLHLSVNFIFTLRRIQQLSTPIPIPKTTLSCQISPPYLQRPAILASSTMSDQQITTTQSNLSIEKVQRLASTGDDSNRFPLPLEYSQTHPNMRLEHTEAV